MPAPNDDPLRPTGHASPLGPEARPTGARLVPEVGEALPSPAGQGPLTAQPKPAAVSRDHSPTSPSEPPPALVPGSAIQWAKRNPLVAGAAVAVVAALLTAVVVSSYVAVEASSRAKVARDDAQK